MSFLIYGASGYTGKITVEHAVKQGLKPTIAGRTESKLRPIADEFKLDYLVFDLDDVDTTASNLSNFSVVLNCAGPFSKTAKNLIKACLQAGTHYLDITGEIEVFEMAKSFHQTAIDKNIIIMSGVGFDVVPTDCMAKFLHDKMPDATHLELAWAGLGANISHGTMSTMVENLGQSGAIRKDGKIMPTPTGHIGKIIDFGKKKLFCMTIPWGDISTAHFTTSIPNIMVFSAVPKNAYYTMKFQSIFNPIVRTRFIKNKIQAYVDQNITGPNKEKRESGKSLVYGKISNQKGATIEARLETMEAYQLTAEMSILITQKIIENKQLKSGYHTPAELFGSKLVLELAGSNFF
ncbi:MAG TPA: saccharopine dehydrogenase NADP-binding domain-containing protein [Chitinophagales bacterium]|nr:saccharopine dehydrogenase NADP-binding domain-containing protein [Chitinophagales bacterium]HQV77061.1 saccharopine dehydrogenase NADP-binding domain-containing protein [Chitinophagales bacterium]HQW77872.1 saccharopine dehydrogenase NADP-binding domain-containing protein [Chitinophagales bacterium]HRB67434.1 saccharopine dehydrogenase NADP-binding domain-containing protein [Chitinophagales bacterium]HRB69397.1 saccharopine dehydrogenase NADP-binding domain-containing protein [Chitinophagal